MADTSGVLPVVTVVMPVRNEAGYITRSLTAVLAQDYPPERMEVIVADGMSTDATPQIVRSLQASFSNLMLIENPGRIAPAGLNLATALAAGSVIARVDGHCEIAPDYLRRAVAYLESGKADGVGGPIETIGENSTAELIALAMSSTFGVGGSAFRTVKDQTILVDTIAFPVYTRLIVERAGRYDEELVRNQDDEYNYRLRKLGARLLLAADVRSRYYSRGSLGSLFKQYFQYGFWKVRVLQKHPRQMSMRQFVPPAFVAALIGALIIALTTPLGWLPLAGIIVSYVLAAIAASVHTGAGISQMVTLPAIFAAIHISYGLGFLVGLARFAHRWVA